MIAYLSVVGKHDFRLSSDAVVAKKLDSTQEQLHKTQKELTFWQVVDPGANQLFAMVHLCQPQKRCRVL